ncbi:MAG: hypothetical protein KIT84_31450 [Labilithrix sp.]|nr:hypothetical protein [Labilithrix sp.]MCW5815586.1 hypothetical protein [Labilithrix sp.]
MLRHTVLGLMLATPVLLGSRPASAFIFSEHSQITEQALTTLTRDGEVRAIFDELASMTDLCAREGSINETDCLALMSDFVAIAGDHACTPVELARELAASNEPTKKDRHGDNERDHWYWEVRRVAWDEDAELNGDNPKNRRRLNVIDILTDGTKDAAGYTYSNDRKKLDDGDYSTRNFVRRRLNLQLQNADPKYTSRAKGDDGHFQLARAPGAETSLTAFLEQSLAPDALSNATAFYATYHLAALRLAAEAEAAKGKPERPGLLKRAFLAEVFALHFLEDSFAAGHVVGHWGDEGMGGVRLPLRSESVRIGTHDYYCDRGVETTRWVDLASPPAGPYSVAHHVTHGDANMTTTDLDFAAAAVFTSLRQVLLVASQRTPADAAHRLAAFLPAGDESFDSCVGGKHTPQGLAGIARVAGPIQEVLQLEPIPSARSPELPRFRAEVGLFIGAAAAVDGGTGFTRIDSGGEGAIGRARATLRAGVGLGGISTDPMNSLMFVEVGAVALGTRMFESPNSNVGLSVRLRSPGLISLVEGTPLLILAAATRAPWLLEAASTAANGGWLPSIFRSHHITGTWNWQISALRDVAWNFYPRGSDGHFRWEFQVPMLTARSANPSSGVVWAQSNDFWFDLGMTAGRSNQFRDGNYGVYLGFSASSRSFP